MSEELPIFIIGYMASGKTTFGRALGRALGREFIDLDFYIEQRFRTTVSQIFAERGEEGFRKIESNMLREVGEFERTVIACGGGTPCFFDNMDFMLSHGTVVFLEASPQRIVERIVVNNSRRPLMAGKNRSEIAETVDRGLAQRMPYYTRAHIIHPGDNLEDRRQIADTIDSFLASLGCNR